MTDSFRHLHAYVTHPRCLTNDSTEIHTKATIFPQHSFVESSVNRNTSKFMIMMLIITYEYSLITRVLQCSKGQRQADTVGGSTDTEDSGWDVRRACCMWVDIIIHTNNNIIKFNDCLPIHDFMNGKHFNNTGNLGRIDRNFKTGIYLLGSWQESFSQYMRGFRLSNFRNSHFGKV